MDDQDNVYRIPAVNFPRLENEIHKINRRAFKLGCELVELKVLNVITEKRVDETLGLEYDYVIHECTIEGSAPKLAGWTMVAAIDPQDNGEKLIREVPGEKCPVQYRSADLHCDHCNTNRRRKNVYILRHDNGEHKQIGRTCIQDFLGGANPESFLARASYLKDICELASDAEDKEWGLGGGRGMYTVPISHFLAITSIVIRRMGWLPRSGADEMTQIPTANRAWDICTNRNKRELEAYLAKHNLYVEDGDVQRAEAALAWGIAIDPNMADNNYLHDLGVCCRQGYVTYKTAGYVASVINAHQRTLERALAEKRRNEAPINTGGHVGVIGEREAFTLKIMSSNSQDSAYGVKTTVRFVDDQGNNLIWWATGCPDWIKLGETFAVHARVKKHGEYQGVKQTVIERVVPDVVKTS